MVIPASCEEVNPLTPEVLKPPTWVLLSELACEVLSPASWEEVNIPAWLLVSPLTVPVVMAPS
ncbi:MAG: hypothetical protein QOE70_6856 [Chthoniobacter sp.]|nr:hypothetical protein [Chthoniobacter sp.]